MDDLLIQLEQRLPPELLRIIAVKYRRRIEIKPQLCPEAITQEPLQTEPSSKSIYNTYRIRGYYFDVCQLDHTTDVYIYEMEDTRRFHYMTLYYYTETDLIDCRKYLHDKPFPIEIFIAGLILLKRGGYTIDGDTRLHMIERSLNDTICIKQSSLRETLYMDPTLWHS